VRLSQQCERQKNKDTAEVRKSREDEVKVLEDEEKKISATRNMVGKRK